MPRFYLFWLVFFLWSLLLFAVNFYVTDFMSGGWNHVLLYLDKFVSLDDVYCVGSFCSVRFFRPSFLVWWLGGSLVLAVFFLYDFHRMWVELLAWRDTVLEVDE